MKKDNKAIAKKQNTPQQKTPEHKVKNAAISKPKFNNKNEVNAKLQNVPKTTMANSPAVPQKKKKNKKNKKKINISPPESHKENIVEERDSATDDEQMETDVGVRATREQEREKLKAKYLEEYSSSIEDPKLPQKTINILKDVIAYVYRRDNKIALKMSFEQNGLLLDTKYDAENKTCKFFLNNKVIVTTSGEETEAVKEGLDLIASYLRYYCYTIKRIKEYYATKPPIERKEDDGDKVKTFENRKLDEGNLGFKMMETMGWKEGETLGKEDNADAISEPVSFNIKKSKSGVGEEPKKAKNIPMEELKEKINRYAKRTNQLYDLVFCASFTNPEVNILKNHATHMKLFPQMLATNYNNKKKRLVISKKLQLKEIREYLEADNLDLCNKYILIPPLSQQSMESD